MVHAISPGPLLIRVVARPRREERVLARLTPQFGKMEDRGPSDRETKGAMMSEITIDEVRRDERVIRTRSGIVVLPAGAWYCAGCRIVALDEHLTRHDPRRHPHVAAFFCDVCRQDGTAELTSVEHEREAYKRLFRSTRAMLRRMSRKIESAPGEEFAA
jgi:hypothetical protein